MKIGRWSTDFDGESMKYSFGVEEQMRIVSESMLAMEDRVARKAVVEYLHSEGWTVEPPEGFEED